MRIRGEMVLLGAAIAALAIFMNQAPSAMGNASPSPLASDASGGPAATDLLNSELPVGLSGVPAWMVLVASEYLRKSRAPATNGQIFSYPQAPELVPRRDQLMIMVDILDFARQPVTRKRIIRSLNMSQSQLKKYLHFLIEKGFLLEELGQSRTYRVTEKGREFVRLLED
ncbi:MAG: winged helix-turn-helix domain-containing protein [Nitrososphaerales archaeon]